MRHPATKKTVLLRSIENQSNNHEPTKLSLARCREVLCSTGIAYTDEEVLAIRDFLYQLASIALQQPKKVETIIIPFTNTPAQPYEESYYLRTG